MDKDIKTSVAEIWNLAQSGWQEMKQNIATMTHREYTAVACAPFVDDLVSWLEDTWRDRQFMVQTLCFEQDGVEGKLVQISSTNQDWVRDALRAVVGGQLAVNIRILPERNNLKIEIGRGKWLDKTFAGVVAWSLFAPLVVVPVLGAYRQKKMIDKVEQEVTTWLQGYRDRMTYGG